MKNIGILTSGGDSPGMNACIRAVTRAAIKEGYQVIGIKRGFKGLIEGEFIPLTTRSVGNILHSGGTILKTSRCPEFLTKEGFKKAIENIKKANIEDIVIIGGDGSFKGAIALKKAGVNVVSIPATIDNDLYYTDWTIGFDTAVNTIVQVINNVRDTSLSHDRISVVEVMGAACGDIALNVGVATGADYIVVPEIKFNPKDLYSRLLNNTKNGKTCSIVVVNESVCSASELAKNIEKNTAFSVRPLVVGHIQRGGTPTADDRILALQYGTKAIELIKENYTGKAVGILNKKLIAVDLENVFKNAREFDSELYKTAMKVSF